MAACNGCSPNPRRGYSAIALVFRVPVPASCCDPYIVSSHRNACSSFLHIDRASPLGLNRDFSSVGTLDIWPSCDCFQSFMVILHFFLACFLSIYLLTYFSSCRLTRTSLIAAVTLTYTALDTVFADERTRMVYVHPLIHYCNSTPSLQGRRGTQTAAVDSRGETGCWPRSARTQALSIWCFVYVIIV